jgi:hypothetical protein
VTAEVRKPLFLQVFHVFEPARSTSLKQLSVKDLTRDARKSKRCPENILIRSHSAAISTVGGRG